MCWHHRLSGAAAGGAATGRAARAVRLRGFRAHHGTARDRGRRHGARDDEVRGGARSCTAARAASAADTFDAPPEPLDSAIVFAPAGEIVPAALSALDRGGTLAIAGIHLSDIPSLRYADHLFQERQMRSVTANTRRDGEELMALAARLDLRLETVPYPLGRAEEALADLAADRVNGAAVLLTGLARDL